MSSAKDYRRLVVKMGDASTAHEKNSPPPRPFLDTFIFGSLAALVFVVVLVAVSSRMRGQFIVDVNPTPTADLTVKPAPRAILSMPR